MVEDFLKTIKEAIFTIDPEAHIMLYGSRARNNYESDSDWDLLILLKENPDICKTEAIRDILYDIELESGEVISPIIRDVNEWNSNLYKATSFYKNVTKEAIQI